MKEIEERKRDIRVFQTPFLSSKTELGEFVCWDSSLLSRKPLCPGGRMAAQSLEGKGGAGGLWLSSQIWWWTSHCSPVPTSPGWGEGKG